MKPNKLTTLFLLIIPGVAIVQFSNAQIVYTDVNPDVTTSGTYNLDLNNDGTIDFVIAHTSKSVNGNNKCKGQTATNDYLKVTPLDNNQVLDMGTNVRTMSPYETIDANVGSWRGNKDQVMFSREFSCESYYISYLLQPTFKGFWA